MQRVKVVADRAVAAMSDFVCGANEEGFHLTGVNWGRDLPEPQVADIRNVVAGDPSPDGKGTLEIARGIEVGHIFQLRTKYSEAMKAPPSSTRGKAKPFEMGCYGIGVTRIVAAAIEQNHDARGIVFPAPMAPFEACLVPIGYHKSAQVREAADRLHAELLAGRHRCADGRPRRAPGVLFADMELIGIPHRVVLSERGLAAGNAEYKGRRDEKPQDLPLAGVVRASSRSGSPLDEGALLSLLLLLAWPLAALGGAQIYEPLADSVRGRLSRMVADRAPATMHFRSARRRPALARRDGPAPGEAHPRPPAAPRAAARGAVRGDARAPRPAAGARRHRGGERLSQVRGVARRRARLHAGDAVLGEPDRAAGP